MSFSTASPALSYFVISGVDLGLIPITSIINYMVVG